MAVPKLPLVVPKNATSLLVPKVAPKLSTAFLPKNRPLTKSVHSGSTLLPNTPGNDNSVQKSPDKLTKLVSHSNLNASNPNSIEESQNVPDSTQVKIVPVQAFNQNSKNFEGNNSLLNSRKPSNSSFHDDLASRLNNSSILNDLGVPQYKNLLSKSTSSHGNLTSDMLSESASLQTNKSSKVTSNNSDTDYNVAHSNGVNDKLELDSDVRDDVGYTPWLKIERRINQIRSMASKELNPKPAVNKNKQTPNLYNNYNPEYEQGTWKKELPHPLSYGMVQKLNDKRQFELPKDNWKFINGFLRPRRKPFTSMSEMSKHFQKVDTKDQYELIKLLLACRDLEKLIEEQHTVLDMLDHDLREARDLFPDSLNNVTTQKLHGSVPEDEPFYPSSDAPLFIKGRVFLLPNKGKNNGEGKK